MKKDDKILRENLQEAIADANSRPSTFEKKIKTMMSEMYNVPLGDTVDILNGKIPMETASNDTVYKIARVLYELNKTNSSNFNINKIDVHDYYTDIQIEKYEKKIQAEDLIGDIVIPFGSWIKVNDDQYVIVLPIDFIIKCRDARRFRYNPKTQRDMTFKETKNGIVKFVTLVSKALHEIKKLMSTNKFISDDLTININPDICPEGIYFDEKNSLVIPKDSVIDIIDGFHRYKCMTETKDDIPDWDYNCIFNIVLFDEEKAYDFIRQRDKKNHLSKTQTTNMNTSDEANYLINRLNGSSNFLLNGTIDKDKMYTLNRIIHKLFDNKENPLTKQRAIELFKVIETNINSLVEEKSYYDTEITSEMWFIYLFLIKYCIDNEQDFIEIVNKANVDKVLATINFNKEPTPSQYKLLEEVIKNV